MLDHFGSYLGGFVGKLQVIYMPCKVEFAVLYHRIGYTWIIRVDLKTVCLNILP